MLRINGLTIAYGTVQVVHGVTMNVEEGQIVALIGPNGAGKSSVLRSVSGLVRPKAGDIVFLGANIVGAPAHEIALAGIAHVMEGRHLFGGLSVEDNLILAGSRDDRSSAGNLEAVYQRWPRLRERRAQLAGTLSGGEQQMLAIGRALVTRPRLLILDEPSWGLAPRIIRELMDTFAQLRREGVTIFLCEQMANLALKICDYAYVMTSGRVALEGESQDLLANPELQATYLGGEIREAGSIPTQPVPSGAAMAKGAQPRSMRVTSAGLRPGPMPSTGPEIDRAEKESARQERTRRSLAKTVTPSDLVPGSTIPQKEKSPLDRYFDRERRRQMRVREREADKRRTRLEQELSNIRKDIVRLGAPSISDETGKTTDTQTTTPGGRDRRALEAIRRQREGAGSPSSQVGEPGRTGLPAEGQSRWANRELVRREREARRHRELRFEELDPDHRTDLERQRPGPRSGRTTQAGPLDRDRVRLEERRRQRQRTQRADQAVVKTAGKPSREKPDRKIKEMLRRQKQVRGPDRTGQQDSR